MDSNLKKFLAYVDNPANQTKFKDRLRTAVSYKTFVVLQLLHVTLNYIVNISVSSDVTLRKEVKEMGNWLRDQLEQYGVDTKLVDMSKIVQIPELPNLVLGKIDGAPGNNLRTVLVYGHYDVQPVGGSSDQSRHNRTCIRLSQTMIGRRRATTLSS